MKQTFYNENKQRGTFDFPFELYHIDSSHPRYVMDYHWHMEYEIVRVLEGTLHMIIDGTDLTVHPKDLVFITGGLLHAGRPDNCVYQCIVFDLAPFLSQNPRCQSCLQKILDHSLFIHRYFPAASGADTPAEIVGKVFDAMEEQPEGYEMTVFGQLYRFFGVVFARRLYSEATVQTRRDTIKSARLKTVLDFMDANYAQPLTLAQLAGCIHMSPRYFCRFFRDMTHRTPMDYLNQQRVEHAACLLASTDLSVTEAAYSCGFNDLSYFIKIYKKYKGITPGKGRRQSPSGLSALRIPGKTSASYSTS